MSHMRRLSKGSRRESLQQPRRTDRAGENGAPMSNGCSSEGRNERCGDRCPTLGARTARLAFHGFVNAPARQQRAKKKWANTKGSAPAWAASQATHADTPSVSLTVHVLEDVENGEDLPVVGHQCLPHHVGRRHQVLQDLQGGADHLTVSRVQGVWKVKVREKVTQDMNTILPYS